MKWFRLRLGLPVAVLLLGTIGQVVSAEAHTATCRTDPTITLSNGVTLSLYEDIGDSPSDVMGIRYMLIVPEGVTITSVSYSGPVPDSAQSVALMPSGMPGNYDEYAYVETGAFDVPVAAYMSANDEASVHVSGYSHQLLHARLRVD